MIIDPNTLDLPHPRGFIVFEGVNGAGKSTLMSKAATHLRKKKKEVLETFEPGDGEFGEKIRQIVLNQKESKLDPITELFLFAADRKEHVTKIIEPALSIGQIVLCDRYLYSTTAFQGYGRELPFDIVDQINAIAAAETLPDLVILLDLDPELGLKRTKKRCNDDGPDSFEDEEIQFHKRLHSGFLEIAEKRPEPFIVLDASSPPEQVFQQIIPLLDAL